VPTDNLEFSLKVAFTHSNLLSRLKELDGKSPSQISSHQIHKTLTGFHRDRTPEG
jgi:hypothetical protein